MRMVMCTNRRRKMIDARCAAYPSKLVSGMRQFVGTEHDTREQSHSLWPLQKNSDRFRTVRIDLTITVGVKKEASVDATKDGTFFVCLRRGILNNWNRDFRQEDYEVGKISNSIATHLLTPNFLA